VWIDFTRARSPRALKELIAPYILAPEAVLAEPIAYEVLRHASDAEIRPLQAQFEVMPLLPTPDDLWTTAARLGQSCRRKGVTAGSLDLLIVTIASHHEARIITFDHDFEPIGRVCGVEMKILRQNA